MLRTSGFVDYVIFAHNGQGVATDRGGVCSLRFLSQILKIYSKSDSETLGRITLPDRSPLL